MARSPDLHKRPALLADIVEYLLDKSLSTVTFRTLADGLKVSTYQLVYHFGSRAEMMEAIIQTVSDRETIVRAEPAAPRAAPTLEGLISSMRLSWQLSISPRGRQLQRLEFEAAILENLDPQVGTVATSAHSRWVRSGVAALEQIGVDAERAAVAIRCLVAVMYGLHYELMLGDDLPEVQAAFDRVLERFRAEVESAIVVEGRPGGPSQQPG